MSLPRYPEYRDSGVEWLGDIPSHWAANPINVLATLNDETLPENTDAELEIDYVDIGSVSLSGGIERTESLTFSDAPSRARRIVRDGDVLVSTVRTYLKAIAPVVSPAPNLVASTGFAVVRPKSGQYSGYLKYGLQCEAFVHQVIARSNGVSYPAINASDLARIPLWNPPFVEQRAIASFLDRETAKIDALIAEQEKLLALLAEKRQATISHAVTRGLDPSAPMKDSEISWLGDVPAHWSVRPLKHVCALLKDGTHLPPPRVEEGVPLLSVRNIDDSVFAFRDDDSMVSAADYEDLCRAFVPRPGDVLMAIVGATLGKVAIVPEGMDEFHIQRSLAIFRVRPILLPEWLFYCFGSAAFQRLLWQHAGFSAQPGIYLGTLKDFHVPVPTLDEQIDLVKVLRTKVSTLDALVLEVEQAIALLKERRSALIAAAVTGQIDVRGAMEPQAA